MAQLCCLVGMCLGGTTVALFVSGTMDRSSDLPVSATMTPELGR
jgi:hypothetical protein